MPFILVGIALVFALLYALFWLYSAVAALYGQVAGLAAVAAMVALFVGAIRLILLHHRSIHGVVVNGNRILSCSDDWGGIRVDAEQKQGTLRLNGQIVHFIFADIVRADPVDDGDCWTLTLRLAHTPQAEWHIPIGNGRQVRRWAKILRLAATQEL